MKRIIQLLLLIILSLFAYGLYLQYYEHNILHQKIMGFGVLLLVFLLLPLFIYHRYKDKNLEDFRFKGFNQDNKND